MDLNLIIKDLAVKKTLGELCVEVDFLCFDSRKCKSNCVYFALNGNTLDGHLYIDAAIQNGATAIVCEQLPSSIEPNISYLLVEDSYSAMAEMASKFYHNPSSQLKLVGVTGTNGKTSTVTLLFDVFTQMGHSCAMLSTVENRIGDQVFASTHTTPDIISINQLLAKAVQQGAQYAFMEVSSHGLHQKRIQGLRFHIAAFTNLSHDHLDYHDTFLDYLHCKKSFFDGLQPDAIAITNADDKNGLVMLQNTKAICKKYALKTIADYQAKIIESDFDGMLLQFNQQEFWTKLIGKFNVYNLLLVYAIAAELGKDNTQILTAISLLKRVKGRFETYKSDTGLFFIVDYAHTPDALENILKSINEIRTQNEQLIVVFGCGGDRDSSKRPIMGDIATSNASLSIITSDNPRTENPQQIISDIAAGVQGQHFSKYNIVPDRKEAIKMALQIAKPKDIILVAGKGHENYQEINGIKHPFDDQETITELAQLLKK